MTTIAVRDGVMAADSAVFADKRFEGYAVKVRRLSGGTIIGFAGDLCLFPIVADWVERGAPSRETPDTKDEAFSALLLRPDGSIHFIEKSWRLVCFDVPYAAIGSGCDFAFGAMAHGANAQEAVSAAITHDAFSGGPVTALSLET